MGTQIKRVIPIQPNYCCGEVKQKNYSGVCALVADLPSSGAVVVFNIDFMNCHQHSFFTPYS